jgi:nucleoid DNA-binding protein
MVSDKVAKNVLAYVDGGDFAVVKVICEAFCDMILNEVKEGREVSLTNFLKFKRVTRKPRTFNIPPKKGAKSASASDSDQEGSEVSKGERAFKSERYAMQVSIMAQTKKTFEAIPIVEASEEKVVKAKGSKKAASSDEKEAESSVPSVPSVPSDEQVAKKPAAKKVTAAKKVAAKKEEPVKKVTTKKKVEPEPEVEEEEEEEEEEVEEEPEEEEPPKKKTAKESPKASPKKSGNEETKPSKKKTSSYSESDIE